MKMMTPVKSSNTNKYIFPIKIVAYPKRLTNSEN